MSSSTNPQQAPVTVDDDLDAQIAELNRRKAERERRVREEEESRLAEVARRAAEVRAEMSRAAVARMVAERVGTMRHEAEGGSEAEEVVSGGPAMSGGERGHKRARSTTCGRCARHGLDCTWLETGRATSCLACQAAKAKCGASPVRKQPHKEVWKGSPESENEDGSVLLVGDGAGWD